MAKSEPAPVAMPATSEVPRSMGTARRPMTPKMSAIVSSDDTHRQQRQPDRAEQREHEQQHADDGDDERADLVVADRAREAAVEDRLAGDARRSAAASARSVGRDAHEEIVGERGDVGADEGASGPSVAQLGGAEEQRHRARRRRRGAAPRRGGSRAGGRRARRRRRRRAGERGLERRCAVGRWRRRSRELGARGARRASRRLVGSSGTRRRWRVRRARSSRRRRRRARRAA